MSSAWLGVVVLVLAMACGAPATSAPVASATPETPQPPPEPVAPPSVAPVEEPPAPAATTAPSWPAPPSAARVANGCGAGEPLTVPYGSATTMLAGTPSGAVAAYLSSDGLALSVLTPDGEPTGSVVNVALPGIRTPIGVARLGGGLVAVADARCPGTTHGRPCLVAVPLDLEGHERGARGSRQISWSTFDETSWLALATQGPYLVPTPSAGAVWIVASFETSHDGRGVRVARVSLDAAGAAIIDAPISFRDDLADGAELMGFRVDANDDDLVALFGSNGEDIDGPTSVRYLGRASRGGHTVHVDGLGNVVHDLALDGDGAHVLFERDHAYFAASIGADGRVEHETPVDRTQPFPPPFTDRLLVELAGPADHPQRVLHDASGRRIGDPIPQGSLAWTSTGALVADPSGTVWHLTCGAH